MANKFLLVFLALTFLMAQSLFGQYVCKPCKQPCDTLNFAALGSCPHCKMQLMAKATVDAKKKPVSDKIEIKPGSGFFPFASSDHSKPVAVHYYYPQGLNNNSPVVFIIHGAGRNGTTYRDAWIEHAEKYNVLVLAPEYNEASFPGFWSYNLAGMIKDVKVNKDRTGIASYSLNLNEQEWILNDFDKIFDAAKNQLKLTTNTYDLFGHSAGGQLLHRLAMFKPDGKANRILASNAGWYTVPDRDSEFPYGLKNSTATDDAMKKAFNAKLVVLLGEKDNENETRGDLVRSKEVDVQGIHRLARGRYFYDKAQQYANGLNAEFKWKLIIVPNVGHDHAAMSQAAARYLYAGKTE